MLLLERLGLSLSEPDRLARLNAFTRGTRFPVSDVLGAALHAQQEYARRIVTMLGEPWPTFLRLGLHENADKPQA